MNTFTMSGSRTAAFRRSTDVPWRRIPARSSVTRSQSPTHATVNLFSSLLEHRFGSRITLRNRISYGDYDKFYQNVFPGAVNAAATTVAISAYNNATTRQNLFNQTDLIVSAQTGRFGHTLLLGTEFGRQETDNFRRDGILLEPRRQCDDVQCAADRADDFVAG